jgi:hypothetical protein
MQYSTDLFSAGGTGVLSVKIFLSTVSDEFLAYRDQLRADLTRPDVEVKVQEEFKDIGGVTLDKLDRYVSACDAVVHFVGDMTGAAAKPTSTQAILAKYPDLFEKLPPLRESVEQGLDISYTQWEAWLALYHDKVLLIATADSVAPRGPNYAPTDQSRAAQQAHLQRLRTIERYPGCVFTSPDQLAKHIAYTAILDLLVKARVTVLLQRLGLVHNKVGEPDSTAAQLSILEDYRARVGNFVDRVTMTEYGQIAFGGRASDLHICSSWLANQHEPARLLIVGDAGLGKTTLDSYLEDH